MAAFAVTTVDLEERHVPAWHEADSAWLNYASLGLRRPGHTVSACVLARRRGRLRSVLVRPGRERLAGTVEVDET